MLRKNLHNRHKMLSGRLDDDAVFCERDLLQDALNALFLAEEVPENHNVSLDARLADRVEHKLLAAACSYICLELTHCALPFPAHDEMNGEEQTAVESIGVSSHDPAREVLRHGLARRRPRFPRDAAAFGKIRQRAAVPFRLHRSGRARFPFFVRIRFHGLHVERALRARSVS